MMAPIFNGLIGRGRRIFYLYGINVNDGEKLKRGILPAL